MKTQHYMNIGGEPQLVTVVSSADRSYRVHLGNEELIFEAAEVQPREYVLIDDQARVYDVLVARDGQDHPVVHHRRGSTRVEIVEEAQLARRALSGAAGRRRAKGEVAIEAPMPGRVVKALVQEGAQVKEGQGVIVVEAMKMENELRSPVAGKVKQIVVDQGADVEAGHALVVIDAGSGDGAA